MLISSFLRYAGKMSMSYDGIYLWRLFLLSYMPKSVSYECGSVVVW